MKNSQRKLLLTLLVVMFFAQGFLVYSDKEKSRSIIFSQASHRGKKIWLQYNCQSCHQIYGFGGFLGPDLTNRGKLFEAESLQELLAEGPSQMPSIKISLTDARDLEAFFKAMDKTGISIAKSSTYQKQQDNLQITSIPWFDFEGEDE